MTKDRQNSGKLFVVATPIGNLGDLSPRAQQVLQEADLVLAEDTRSFGILKKKFAIETPVKSYHDHSERNAAPKFTRLLLEGKNLALVSEAGTPCISDPGYHLVKSCRSEDIEVVSVPGPSAAVSALSISGFEINRFTFEGFLPQKSGKRAKALQAAVNSGTTTVFYESPFRILKTLQALSDISPDHEIMLARELTKLHEECTVGTAAEVLEEYSARQSIKGEFVLILRGVKVK